MIFLIFYVITLIVIVLIRAFTVHKIFGFSIKLLASLFDSLTHFVLLLGQAADKTQQMKTTENIELQPVKTHKQNSKIPISKIIQSYNH